MRTAKPGGEENGEITEEKAGAVSAREVGKVAEVSSYRKDAF